MKHDGLSCGLKFYYTSHSGTHLKQFMDTTTGISQLFRNLCRSSVWSYAILWKLQETTQMLLTCEDACVIPTKSHATMEYSSCTRFLNNDPVVTTFGYETNARTNDILGFSIEAVISNISRHCYFLGEGIVGVTASTEKHKWISLWELNSRVLLEYPEELQLQVAAGIKTILLVPVLPLGVVQLGSLYELSEDLKMVDQIKDLFLTYQYTLELQSTFDLETDTSNFQTIATQDWTNLSYDKVIEDEFPLPKDEPGTNSSEEIIWDAMCNELFSDYSMEQIVFNSSINAGSTLVGDQSFLSYRDEEIDMIPVISNCLAFEDPIMSDNGFSYDPHHIEEAYLGFGEEFDVVMDSMTDSIFLNCPGESIQSNSPFEFHETAWIAEQPDEAYELTNPISIFQVQVPEPVAIMKDNSANYLSADENLESYGYQNSSITHYKDGLLMVGSDVSNTTRIHGTTPSLISKTEGFTSHLMCFQNNSINVPSSNENQQDVEEQLPKRSNKQERKRGCHRPRPRDRQLIQERITELRGLIPNGSKCSIDELLERAVAHMMFLESVPAHADKLNKSNRTKVGKDSKIHEKQSSLVCELETKQNNLPLIIENLERPDQMLIEMQCRDYGLFLDTAQAFKRLKLIILEGTLQSRPREQQQWAHFILQVPQGFNRMDVLWPLMRLLQFNFS